MSLQWSMAEALIAYHYLIKMAKTFSFLPLAQQKPSLGTGRRYIVVIGQQNICNRNGKIMQKKCVKDWLHDLPQRLIRMPANACLFAKNPMPICPFAHAKKWHTHHFIQPLLKFLFTRQNCSVWSFSKPVEFNPYFETS